MHDKIVLWLHSFKVTPSTLYNWLESWKDDEVDFLLVYTCVVCGGGTLHTSLEYPTGGKCYVQKRGVWCCVSGAWQGSSNKSSGSSDTMVTSEGMTASVEKHQCS